MASRVVRGTHRIRTISKPARASLVELVRNAEPVRLVTQLALDLDSCGLDSRSCSARTTRG